MHLTLCFTVGPIYGIHFVSFCSGLSANYMYNCYLRIQHIVCEKAQQQNIDRNISRTMVNNIISEAYLNNYALNILFSLNLGDSSSLTNEKDHHYFLNSADVCW